MTAASSPTTKKLYLSNDRKLAGVCGGIALYLGVDPTLIRLAWIVGTVITGFVPGLIAYIVAAIIIPPQPPTFPNGKASV